jgi:hypothetical protein
MNKEHKTVLETLLDKLPMEYVDRIANNIDNIKILYEQSSEAELELMVLFDWVNSLEGWSFWNDVYNYIVEGGRLPKFPIVITYKKHTVIYADNSMYVMNSHDTGINLKHNLKINEIKRGKSEKMEEQLLSWLN